MTVLDIAAALETLQTAGIVGLEGLCMPRGDTVVPNNNEDLLLVLPLCDDENNNNTVHDYYFSSSHYHYYHDIHHRQLVEEGFDAKAENDALVTTNVIGALITVCCIAVAAGLFLGLMTLDVLDLQIIVRSSVDDDEVRYATRLLEIVKDRHRLLVTLLLMDTVAYETLPIFLDQLMSGWVAVLLSTSLIVVFGEIFPSGIFTGPNQLYLGYQMAPVVQFFLTILYPIAKPLGKLLDWLVDEDEEDQWYDRLELSALIKIQHEERTQMGMQHEEKNRISKVGKGTKSAQKSKQRLKVIKYVRNKDRHWQDLKAEMMQTINERAKSENNNNDFDRGDSDDYAEGETEEAAIDQLTPPLHQREVDMVEGSLSMKTKLAMDVYTPLKHIYAVPDDMILDQTTITTIYSHGYSRVPVYRRNPQDDDDTTAVTGYLITRQLMLIDWDHKRQLGTLPLTRPKAVSPRMNLVDLLRLLQSNGPLLTFVCARPDVANRALQAHQPIPVEAGLIGIITLVDIMESVLQDRIYDESDVRDRHQAVATLHRWAASTLQSFVRRRRRLIRSGSAQRAGRVSQSPPPKRIRTVDGSPAQVARIMPRAPITSLSLDSDDDNNNNGTNGRRLTNGAVAATEHTPLLLSSSYTPTTDASELV
eukprot:scaffold1270_cov252-Amphora_coffeaeformis.AAC.2